MARKPSFPLVELLQRHPFASEDLLTALLGGEGLATINGSSGSGLRRVNVAGLGVCYADRNEPNASLLGLHRTAVVRSWALEVMGQEAFMLGLSPGMEADGEFYWNHHWWRVWADMAACAPEALRFINQPPTQFRGGARDIVLVGAEGRLEQVARLIERSWPAASREVVLALVSLEQGSAGVEVGEYRSVRPRRKTRTATWSMPGRSAVLSYLKERQSGSRHRSLLGNRARQLDLDDFRLLVDIGSNPLMTPRELTVLESPEADEQAAVTRRLARLEQLELIETPAAADPRVTLEGRKTLTWRGLELLAAHAGTSLETLCRRQPWPLRIEARKKGKTVYSLRWLRSQQEHHRLTRSFALALLEGARRVSRPTGGAEVHVLTTIGGRLLYEDRGSFYDASVRFVTPDAVCTVALWQASWLAGRIGPRRVLARHSLLIEIDRSTMAANRIADRMDRYGEVWRAMAELRPVLLWVIEGTPYREAQILEMMAERDLAGWTVTLDRLGLPLDHEWWALNPLASLQSGAVLAGLRPDEFAGMCPWRTIWRAPGSVRQVPLLALEPWRAAGIRLEREQLRKPVKPVNKPAVAANRQSRSLKAPEPAAAESRREGING